jgi:hypothetical protein
MAQEITATGLLQFAKGGVQAINRQRAQAKFNVNGTRYICGVQTIGNTPEQLNLGEITTPGWYFLANLSTANFVTFRVGALGSDFLKLMPGEFSVGRFATANIYAVADTASVDVEYMVVED